MVPFEPTFIDTEIEMPLLRLPVRSTVVPLSEATVLISPGSRTTPEQYQNVSGVTDIVGTNLYHCAGVWKATQAFPSARTWGIAGAPERKPRTRWDNEITETNWPYNDELAAISLDGMPSVNEVVFVHKLTRTLIVSDLCFNMTNATGVGAWVILSVFGTYQRFGVSRFFASAIKDRPAFERSLGRIFSYDFDKIIVTHGDNVERGGRDILLQALARRGLTPK